MGPFFSPYEIPSMICIHQTKLWGKGNLNWSQFKLKETIIFTAYHFYKVTSLVFSSRIITAKKLLHITVREAVVRRCSVEKVFLESSQNSQENTCARVSFLIKLQARKHLCQGLQLYYKRDSGTGVFLWIFYELSKDNFSYKTLPVAASTMRQNNFHDFCWPK